MTELFLRLLILVFTVSTSLILGLTLSIKFGLLPKLKRSEDNSSLFSFIFKFLNLTEKDKSND